MKKSWILLVPCLVLGLAAPSLAQRTTATVRGTVIDQSRGVIPGATVTAKNEGTGLVRATVTNEEGIYVIPDLPVGLYRVDAELSGFKTASQTGITLRVADEYVVDFTLMPGELTEVVTVEATSTPVKVLGGDVSGVITGQQVRELPLNGRNFLQLATLMPGVSAPDGLNVKDKGLMSGSDLSVSGSDVTANLWTVDGANNNDVGSNRTILVYPSLDAIEEFKILRNSYGPEFGGAGGAQINIVTRGGTNNFSGSAFWSTRNDAFNAKNYFLEQADQPKDELTRNDFGFSIGGPIIKDKLHFFGAAEWNKEDRGTTRVSFVPTEAERNGDFSGPRIAGCSGPIPVDPLTGEAFPGNRIPADRLSPGGLAYLKLYPLPNVTPPAGSCNNWVTSVTTPIDYSNWSARADWTLSASSRIMVRYTQDSWKNGAPSAYSNLWGDDPFPAVDSNWDQPSRSFVASLNQTIGTSATNTLQFSYSANKIEITRGGLDAGLNADILSKIVPIYGYDNKLYGEDTGHPVWWGGAGYAALWNEAPFLNNQDLFVVKDDFTKVFGKHFVKAGVLASFNAKNEDILGNGSQQHSNFWGSAGLNGWGANTGNILSDFLLRDMTIGFSEFSAARQNAQRWRDLEFYVADSWQISPRVTLDYGLRYSIFYNPYTTDDTIMSFVPEFFDPALGSDSCNGLVQPPGTNWCQEAGLRGGAEGPNNSLMNQDFNNFAPRVGVAWDVKGDGKTSIRAGLGQFYQRERLTPVLNLAANPPFVETLSGLRKLDTTEEPCGGCFGYTFGRPQHGRPLDFVAPNNWQWNVMFQQEVFRNSTIEIGYVGNYGYDLLQVWDVNQVGLGADINSNGVDDRLDFVRATDTAVQASVRPYGVVAGNNAIAIWDNTGESQYHSLQTQFISRFGRGSQFQTSYTLGRSRANMSLTNSGGLAPRDAHADNQNTDLDWGRPDVGRTHIFNASLVWLLPALEGQSGVMRAMFGDWEIASIIGAASGQPITVYANTVPNINGGVSGAGANNPNYPNRTDASCRPDGGLDEQIINPAAYSLDGFRLGTIGSARRGDCTGPNYFQADILFAKTFRLTDRFKVQFRWDIFNIFNNTNFLFGSVTTDLNPSSVVYDAPRESATTIVSATPAGNFGQANQTRDARQMQFGLKLLW
jgi:hypothetical protein